jgi:membrane-associated protein
MMLLNISDFFHQLLQHPSELFDPEKLIKYGGLATLIILTFAQTGLFFCFFLPGDAILFTAGVFIATKDFNQNIFLVCIALIIAAFLGNITGYYIGKKTGPYLLKKKDSWVFRKQFIIAAEEFYKKYGVLATSIAMFFMIIRTFAPIFAGIIKLELRKMVLYSAIGATIWICTMVLAGFFLGRIPFVEKYLEYFILAIILSVTVPALLRLFFKTKKQYPISK